MATLEAVHVLEMDRATTKMECVRINPTRTFGERTDHGTAFYIWQGGTWFGLGGQEMDPAIVPQKYRDEIAANPPLIEEKGPAVIVTCEFCGEKMNRANKDAHLVQHVRDAMATTGRPPATVTTPADVPPPTTIPPAAPRPGQRAASRADAV